jgi:hypothetical protein
LSVRGGGRVKFEWLDDKEDEKQWSKRRGDEAGKRIDVERERGTTHYR